MGRCGPIASNRQHILFTQGVYGVPMAQCEDCGQDTMQPATLIQGEMQRLCDDCRPDSVPEADAETNEMDAPDDMDEPDTQQSMDDMDTENAVEPMHSAWDVDSIRDHWDPNTVRLPDGLQRRFDAYHKRLDLQFTENQSDRSFTKDRWYKPLVVALGLRAIHGMDIDDIKDAMDTLERVEHLDEWGTNGQNQG